MTVLRRRNILANPDLCITGSCLSKRILYARSRRYKKEINVKLIDCNFYGDDCRCPSITSATESTWSISSVFFSLLGYSRHHERCRSNGVTAFAITLHETFSCLAKVRVEHIHPISALDAHVESYKRRECLYQAVEWEIELHR